MTPPLPDRERSRLRLRDSNGPLAAKVDASLALLDEAFETHKPDHVFCLFSGGHDSLTATALGQEWAKTRKHWSPVAHVNTGTGIAQTRQFVIDTVQRHQWSLMELHPPRSFESLVMEMGFPGPGFHDRLAYPRLKERCLRVLARMAPKDGKVMFVTGVREQESVRRMEHVERIQDRGRIIWAAPIWDWSKIDCNHFIADRKLERNEVVDAIHMSGECLCGTMAKPGELEEIARWYPEKAAEIRALEDRVEKSGLRACRWGRRPPDVAREQMRAFLTPNDGSYPMLCATCTHGQDDVPEEQAA